MAITKHTVVIPFSKYGNLVDQYETVNDVTTRSLTIWMNGFCQFYDCIDFSGPLSDPDGHLVVELSFRDEEDALWFRLKWL